MVLQIEEKIMVREDQAAVIGSGIMGGGIAALLAGAGVDVLLLDIVPFDLTNEEKNDPAARNRIVQAGMQAALATNPSLFYTKKDASRISTGNLDDDIEKLSECDWIVEVVVENLKIKRELFKGRQSQKRRLHCYQQHLRDSPQGYEPRICPGVQKNTLWAPISSTRSATCTCSNLFPA